ncbi:MAG TPA: XrtA/PEP-CTERM system amidotransferase [Candidatus Binatia bacterium]|nr:XrtA/PEP-CTERM system amidotransferase [Candidatus Binatia bacterium]
MCAIAGIFKRGGSAETHRSCLKRMGDVMTHRGPDGEGYHVDGSIGLAHRRLSIIDVEGGAQPLCNEDGSVWIVFNGEIYNYIELRDQLAQKGHVFKTSSDTEVIVHLYEEKGDAFVEFLRGMFAIALWDRPRKRLVLARDRLGKKPLYYARCGDVFVFASEIKALLQYPEIPKEIDHEAIVDYFSLLYIPAPKSIFRSIRKLRPAHILIVDEKGYREKRYWDLSFDAQDEKSEEQWCEELLETLRDSVRLRLRSDVPLGAFLSGGVDSSAVVALMSGMNSGSINTCSVGFDEKEFDESGYARSFAHTLGTEHHEERVRPSALSILDKLAWHYDEPFADSSAVPTYYVSMAARRHVTVALSGDGGDENFAGYRRYHHDSMENRFRCLLPAEIRRPLFSALGAVYPKLDWAPRPLRAQATFRAFSRDAVEGYFYSVSAIKPEMSKALLSADFRRGVNGYTPTEIFRDYYDRAKRADHLSRLQYLDVNTYLVDDILVKVDRASMANSLEVRCPLLDHRFMELIARIPSALKLKSGKGKYIFKKALHRVLAKEILARPKQGFAVPLAAWFRGEIKAFTADVILGPDPLGLLNSKAVNLLWRKHLSGARDYSAPLWTILMYRLWQNVAADTKRPID